MHTIGIAAFGAGVILASIVWAVIFKNRSGNETDKAESANSTTSRQLQELSKLTGSLAHEIKNPLSIIKVNLKLAGENLDDNEIDRVKRKITVVSKELERVEDILSNFLNFLGESELNLATVDVNELIDELVDFYSAQAWKNNIKLRFMAHSEKLTAKVDPSKIKQVVLNLFINAQQAMEDGGELMILTAKQDNFARITINDTGKGIEPEKIDKIFNAFYTSRNGGTGLGLATAKKVILEHNGKIFVESEPGKGSSFIILLPLVENAD